MHDVLIVGARCAGSALALSLARDGLDTVMIDRTTFPSDTMSGHFIQPAGVSALRRLGVLEHLDSLGAPTLERMSLDFGPLILAGQPAPAKDGTAIAYAPRRYAFDPMFTEAAVAAGADLRERTSFLQPIEESGRIVGVRTARSCGKTDEVRARLVIGADGKHSRFARSVGAAEYAQVPALTCCWYGYWDGLPVSGTELRIREGLFSVATRTNDGLTFLAFAWPRTDFHRIRNDVPKAYMAAAARFPDLADRLFGARQVGRFAGTGDTNGFFRSASGPGWALVGDAGYHKDPITAQGMTDSFLHAEILANCIVDGLGGTRPLDEALADYGRRRDALAWPIYQMTADLARLAPPPPDAVELLAGIASDPEKTRRFLGVMAGTVDPGEFAPQADGSNAATGTEAA